MNTYYEFEALAKTRKRKLANNTYLIVREDGGFGIKLHDTEVVIHYPDRVVLDSGGWKTVTTKDRMNNFSEVSIHQAKGVWYANDLPYEDGITFYSDGHVSGEGADPKEFEKLRKRVNKFAEEYTELFLSGDMDKPSEGDCWMCHMGLPDGGSHIHSHLEEDYFVPSMINYVKPHISPFTSNVIAEVLHGIDVPDIGKRLAKHQIQRGIQQYCLTQLNMVR